MSFLAALCYYLESLKDPVANPQCNFGFGDMDSYLDSKPKDYVLNGAIDATDWLSRTLDVQGYRIDDVKGMAVEAVRRVLASKSMSGRFAGPNVQLLDGQGFSLHERRRSPCARSGVNAFFLEFPLL